MNYYFVNAILQSPIHCFWISELDLVKLNNTNEIQTINSNL